MDKDRLIIGAYILRSYARTEKHVKDLADCGIDMIICLDDPDEKTLDLLEKYHVGSIVSGVLPHWWGGDGGSAGKMADANPIEKYRQAAAKFKDHPAIWGIDIGDEPSALDFEHYGRVADAVNTGFADQFPYLNLYPNYASVAGNNEDQTQCQLGTETYAEYIQRYIEKVDLPYISYDFYVYSLPEAYGVGKMLDNFRIVADACRKTGRDFWYIPQVNSLYPEVFTSENRLRYQAYTALAYGATVISWACYTGGWWENNVLDKQGNKTEQYEKLKKINAELKNIGPLYMKYRNTSTHLLGFDSEPWLSSFPEIKTVSRLDTGVVRDLHADGGKLVVGQMVHKEDGSKTAYLICNATDCYDRAPSKTKVSFYANERTVKIYSGDGTAELVREGDGAYSFELENSHAVMITLQ